MKPLFSFQRYQNPNRAKRENWTSEEKIEVCGGAAANGSPRCSIGGRLPRN
jgi:hypothetical protein